MPVVELCYLSANEAIKRFTDHSLSPVELIQTLTRRSEQVEPHINAFTETYFEDALAYELVFVKPF